MKRNKEKGNIVLRTAKIRRIAAAMAAALVLFSAGGMTALGMPPRVTIEKTVDTGKDGDKVQLPKTTFTFSIKPEGEAGKLIKSITNEKGETIAVYGGVDGGLYLWNNGTLRVSPEDKGVKGFLYAELNTDSYEDLKPGVYRYSLTEEKGDCDGMQYSDDKYYLDVYVMYSKWDGFNLYPAITVWKADPAGRSEKKVDEIKFVNNYTTHSVSLKKQVEGNQGDTKRKFEFTVKVNGQEGEKFTTDYKDGQGNTLVLDSGTEAKIFLGHDETVTIYGLSPKDTYEFSEISYGDDGYKTEINGADEKDGLTAKGNVSDGEDAVIYINKKNITTPTGVVTYYGPYALLILASGAVSVMFLRRRRER